MNIISKKVILLTSLLTIPCIQSYAAEDNAGVIHFTGEIIEPSCVIQGDSGTDSTVPLGTYPTTLFSQVGDPSPMTPFSITLAECPVTSDGLPAIQLTFTGPTTLTGSTTLLDVSAISTTGTPAATGIGVAVSPAGKNTQFITFDGAEDQVYIDLPTVANDTISAVFNARYISFNTRVTAGPADADMTLNILYR